MSTLNWIVCKPMASGTDVAFALALIFINEFTFDPSHFPSTGADCAPAVKT